MFSSSREDESSSINSSYPEISEDGSASDNSPLIDSTPGKYQESWVSTYGFMSATLKVLLVSVMWYMQISEKVLFLGYLIPVV